ncbi:hypothetical protein [Mesorhizobium sp.]|uniref:hypothetical protein n=1 Tax=Mesorhizobium sp. TaxID=1871066 RepID=UPI001201D6BE|nr:hypothetical protein [Mesorhizobium sp.]TIP09100.1 MAG: hypothetical protein E5X73_28805 [Mesorhizobium sp.]
MLDYIAKEWGVLKGAPLVFFILLALGLGGGFTAGMGWRGQELADAEALIRLKDGQIDGYQKTLSDRLDKVEKQLSAQQLSSIRETLTERPSTVDILDGSSGGRIAPLASQLKSVFSESGWHVQTGETESGVVIIAPDAKDAATIKKALEDAGIKYGPVKGGGWNGEASSEAIRLEP